MSIRVASRQTKMDEKNINSEKGKERRSEEMSKSKANEKNVGGDASEYNGRDHYS